MFALQNAPARGAGARRGWRLRARGGGARRRAKFDLTLALDGDARRAARRRWTYSTDLFDAATVERMLGHLRALLEAGRRGRRTRGSRELPLLATAERAAGAGGVERHARPTYPRDACVHELFEAQAARTPDARGRASSTDER